VIGNSGSDYDYGQRCQQPILNGWQGNDTLDGKTGNDTYQFTGNTWGTDTISDVSGSDTLDFTCVLAML
jgi:Ca2+-binding RTX toxin-like protein